MISGLCTRTGYPTQTIFTHAYIEGYTLYSKNSGQLTKNFPESAQQNFFIQVWRDLKSRTSVRVRDRKRQQALTGNRPVNQEPITEVERRVMALIGSEYIEGNGRVVENVPVEENLQLRLEDGYDSVDSVLSTTTAADDVEVMCATPRIPAKRTPPRSLKREREDEEKEKEMQAKFLEVSSKQADALKLLAECSAANTETNKLMVEAFNRLVYVISSWT
ncbi:uncharacterized protein LOC118751880 isoform X1 [Rhagoletis pomonella]|uniref:uncharacterized protein LOC118751878 isoform X1 n=2 Tax=Rhagoletis pomonella TaxID=28610 RepID=UPI00177D627B|nr:uncharacterized protein LOC118751878 isoform X1 [Rhagoletis pomonella]XP_036342597.1 uncharacterized protein LOC118751880 isoform X1 [Rhagoletis pomonella]